MKEVKINVQADCGNAPKREFLRDFNIAFATNDADFIIQSVHDDIVWEMIGDKRYVGKEAFAAAIKEMASYKVLSSRFTTSSRTEKKELPMAK